MKTFTVYKLDCGYQYSENEQDYRQLFDRLRGYLW